MKKVVIVGNSAAGVAAAEAIREADAQAQITIVSQEPFLAYRRDKILDLLEGKIKERELFYRNADFYKKNAIEVLLEKEVVEINTHKKKIVFKDREFVAFDELLIASGSKVVLPKLAGIQREGVIGLSRLKDVKYIIDNLPIAHTVIIVGAGSEAEALARIIASKKIDVKFFGVMTQPIEGVDVILDNSILEILGDSEVRAVRLTSQKVVGASLVIFSDARQPAIDFLRDTEIQTNRGVIVDDVLRTNLPFVWAAGDVCEFKDKEKACGWENAQSEGQRAGRSICQI